MLLILIIAAFFVNLATGEAQASVIKSSYHRLAYATSIPLVSHRHIIGSGTPKPSDISGSHTLSRYLYPTGGGPSYSDTTFVDLDGMKVVALSFDDGPDLENTPRVLSALRDAKIQATFFIVGSRTVSARPETQVNIKSVMHQIVEDGHELASHSYTHPMMTKKTLLGMQQELEETQTALRAIDPTINLNWFRPPYGDCNEQVISEARRLGLKTIRWDIDPQDWRSGQTPERIEANVLAHLHPGGVILLHSTLPATAEALPGILAQGKAQGYRFITVEAWWQRMQVASPAYPPQMS